MLAVLAVSAAGFSFIVVLHSQAACGRTEPVVEIIRLLVGKSQLRTEGMNGMTIFGK